MSQNVIAPAQIEARLKAELPHWYFENGWLKRRYRTHCWENGVLLTGAIAHLAQAAWHHPDLNLTFGALEVRLRNHDANGVTDKDFLLAAKIEDVAQWRLAGQKSGDGRPPYIEYD